MQVPDVGIVDDSVVIVKVEVVPEVIAVGDGATYQHKQDTPI